MRETAASRSPLGAANSLPNLIQEEDDDEENGQTWACNMCTFQNHPLLKSCEQCDMPKVTGIVVTATSYRPLWENNNLQRSASVVPSTSSTTTNHDAANSNVVHATAL